jgi:hypothetical protein
VTNEKLLKYWVVKTIISYFQASPRRQVVLVFTTGTICQQLMIFSPIQQLGKYITIHGIGDILWQSTKTYLIIVNNKPNIDNIKYSQHLYGI